MLARCQHERLPSYLGVLKRHRADEFVLSHGLDGYSLALDFRVTAANRQALARLLGELTERALAARGTFYFAKDSVLTRDDVERAYGRERLDRFLRIKKQLDPEHVLESDLFRRVFGAPS